ncbi:MAG: DUF1045 domain-containing protein [Roseibium sp.]|nr:DUF1045 domain-containing protein [Roseibium sp.]
MRYAIYFALPAASELMQLGNRWLGRDPFAGASLDQPVLPGMSADRFAALTTEPRRYGFHGTLRAPFSLKDGTVEDALIGACKAFARQTAPFEIAGLKVDRLGSFLALVPMEQEPHLSAFADLCIRAFEPFRAPLGDNDLARRRKAPLTERQDAHLVQFGYPYIFEDFRFHMTLSNSLRDEDEATLLANAARAHFDKVTGKALSCSSFGLYVEAQRGAPFMVHSLFELTGGMAPAHAVAER